MKKEEERYSEPKDYSFAEEPFRSVPLGKAAEQTKTEGKAAGTMAAYKVALAKFAAHAGQKDVRQIDRERLCAYAEYLAKQDYAAKYNASLVGISRQFLEWLYHQGKLLTNPAAKIGAPKGRATRLPCYVSKEDVRRLLESTSNTAERAVLETLYSTGMRASELCALELSDVDFEGEQVRIREGAKVEEVEKRGNRRKWSVNQ